MSNVDLTSIGTPMAINTEASQRLNMLIAGRTIQTVGLVDSDEGEVLVIAFKDGFQIMLICAGNAMAYAVKVDDLQSDMNVAH